MKELFKKIQRFQENEEKNPDYLMGKREASISKIAHLHTINKCLAFLKKLDSPDGEKFIKNYYKTTYNPRNTFLFKQSSSEKDNLQEIILSKKEIILDLTKRISTMLDYSVESDEELSKFKYLESEKRESINPQTIDNLFAYVAKSDFLNLDQKTSIISKIVATRPTYKTPSLKEELYRRIHRQFPEETKKLATDFINSPDISIKKIGDSYLTNFLINNSYFQDGLIKNEGKITHNSLDQIKNNFDKIYNNVHENDNQKKISIHLDMSHVDGDYRLLSQKIDTIDNKEQKEKIRSIYSKIFENLRQEYDQIWLDFSEGELELFGSKHTLFNANDFYQSPERFQQSMEMSGIKSAEIKNELSWYREYFTSLANTADLNVLVDQQIREYYDYSNFKKFITYSPEKIENNIRSFKMVGSICKLLPQNEVVEIANSIILLKYDDPLGEVSKLIKNKIDLIKTNLTKNLDNKNERYLALSSLAKIIPYLNYSDELKLLFQTPLVKDNVMEYFVDQGITGTNMDNILLVWDNRKNLGLSDGFFYSEINQAKIIKDLSNRYLGYKDFGNLEPKLVEVFKLSKDDLNNIALDWLNHYLLSASAYPDAAKYILDNKEKYHLEDSDFQSKDIQSNIIKGLCGLIENIENINKKYISNFIELAKSVGIDTKNEKVKETALNTLNLLIKQLTLPGVAFSQEKTQSLSTIIQFLTETFDLSEKFILENFANVTIDLILNRKYKIAAVIDKRFNIDFVNNIPKDLEHFKDRVEIGKKVLSNINNSYFENKDAKHILNIFLDKYQNNAYTEEFFNKIILSSGKMRNVKRAISTTLAIESLNKNIGSSATQKVDFSFLENKQKYTEIIESLNQHLIDKVCQVIFNGQNKEKEKKIKEKIEKLIESDDQFTEDFYIMINSIAIYANKYPPNISQFNKQTFEELTTAIRKALELDLAGDGENYHNNRFNESKFQFNNLFTQIPKLDRNQIETQWLDISFTKIDFLDSKNVNQKDILKNKLEEIRTTFKSEFLPDLTKLFLEKIHGLETKVAEEGKQQEIYKARLAIFQKYLFNQDGSVRDDTVKIYHEISKDITEIDRAPKPKQDNTKIDILGIQNGIRKDISNIIKALYKLNTINPDKIEKKTNYPLEIDNIIKLFSESLHKLAIVDKKKKPANGAIGSSLEIDLRDHLQHLQEVIGEEEYKNIIQTQTQFVTDFNSLARCPELTGSCQRLTEQTGYNESAYSRILDGNDELIDLWEMKNISGKLQKHQRLARCFSELSAIKIKDQKKLVVMLDRIYTHPEYSTFKEKFAENIIGTALQRFEKNSDFALFFSTKYFSDYKNLIQLLAQKNGYQLNEINDAQYFVNESNLKIDKGKYYDSIQGSENTKEAHYSSITGYLLEKIQS